MKLIAEIVAIAKQAGSAIMGIYAAPNTAVANKADQSPLGVCVAQVIAEMSQRDIIKN